MSHTLIVHLIKELHSIREYRQLFKQFTTFYSVCFYQT